MEILHTCSLCAFSAKKRSKLLRHLDTKSHKEKEKAAKPSIEMSKEELLQIVNTQQKKIDEIQQKLNDSNMALTQAMATKASNPHLKPVSLSRVTISMDFAQLIPQIGSFDEKTGRTKTIRTPDIATWTMRELQEYVFFVKTNNLEKKRNQHTVPLPETTWVSPSSSQGETPSATPISADDQLEMDSFGLDDELVVQPVEYQSPYKDTDDSILRRGQKFTKYQSQCYVGRWYQIVKLLEPSQPLTPQLLVNITLVKSVCIFMEQLYNSPKTAANQIKAARQLFEFLIGQPRFLEFRLDIEQARIDFKARISRLQKNGGERLKQITMDGMLVAGKMLFKEEWVKVGFEIAKTLIKLSPKANKTADLLTSLELIQYRYFLFAGLQYISGGHRPQILLCSKKDVRNVNNKVLLSVVQCKTESHTSEVVIQPPMDYFLWFWVSKILPHWYPGNPFLWPGRRLAEQNTSITCKMFKIVVNSVFPWKDVTSYAVRTYQGSTTKNPLWPPAMFTSEAIQRRHYNITNEVDEYFAVVSEVNQEGGFADAMLQGLQDGISSIDTSIVIPTTNLFESNTSKVISVNKYRYEKNGQLSFLCSVSTINPETNVEEITDKIFIDRDLISCIQLVNKFWMTLRVPEFLPWQEASKKATKRKILE